jgi:2'-5' RNA ligase superfamily
MRTNITLVLADQAPDLAAAHDELYPERVGERIPLSLTLLYPWIPDPTDADLAGLARFFGGRRPFEFELTRVAEFPGAVVYAVPEPDDELRKTMRALWARYPDHPPYGKPGSDPAPHASLARLDIPPPRTLEGVRERVAPLLPARFVAAEASLMEELEPDVWQVRATLPLGTTTS